MKDNNVAFRPSGRLRFAEGKELDFRGHMSSIGARALTTVYRRMLCLVYPLQEERFRFTDRRSISIFGRSFQKRSTRICAFAPP
jgi:hypothetical protein